MSSLVIVSFALAIFLAANIGGNNSAAAMGAAYGAGIRTLREALSLIAVFTILGAVVSGGAVIRTLSHDLLPKSVMDRSALLPLIVIATTVIFIFAANLMKAPIATTHAIVMAMAGVSAFFGELNVQRLLQILVWWVVTPPLAMLVSWAVGKTLYYRLLDWLARLPDVQTAQRVMAAIVTVSGCGVAYTAGANNVGNSMGVLVGAGHLPAQQAAALGGIAMAAGAFLFGRRVIETVGKGITNLCSVQAVIVDLITASILMAANLAGMPISLAETLTMSVIGMSCVKCGFAPTMKNENVRKIALIWTLSPVASLAVSYLAAALLFSR